ncbi:hypothetical protein [Streptomyces sp. FIT100]|uniref:hypothetical protein n=1 Tax=Streptomyces sp. FIT100 TaxID=2837956 RepID=UPI0021CAA314|nr:hypothetical protein [Streptomyces sp. FIT100]
MSPNLRKPGSVRSAALVNAEIRALWDRSGGRLSAVDEARYQGLLVEWAAAVGTAGDAGGADEEAGAGAGAFAVPPVAEAA